MSWGRVQAIFQKDVAWAFSNSKLLGVMFIPVLLVLFFSQLGEGETLGFSIGFTSAYVGLFAT
ncbi:MAG: hypothetical protein AAF203_07385, partial [Pseudomonadota bacterium]